MGEIQLNQQQLTTELLRNVKKEKVSSLNKKGRNAMQAQYSTLLKKSTGFQEVFGKGISLTASKAFLGKKNVREAMELQNQITADRVMLESHSGKVSDQEKAANKRETFGPFTYDKASARAAFSKYMDEKKAREKNPEKAKEPYQCTGKEFLLPPLQNMQGELQNQIAKVMLERDRLREETAKSSKDMTIYQKARQSTQKKFLVIMEDMINTYFKANGLPPAEGGKIPREKEISAAKNHMALAMEKYELFARHFDEHMADALIPDLKKTADYAAKKERMEQQPDPYAEELERLVTEIYHKPEKYVENKKLITQALAEYKVLRKETRELASEADTLSMMLFEKQGVQPVRKAINNRFDAEKQVLSQGAEACMALIRSLLNDQPMQLMDALYVKNRFKKDMPVVAGNKPIQMNKPMNDQDIGFSDYDTKMRENVKNMAERWKAQLQGKTEEELAKSPYAEIADKLRHYNSTLDLTSRIKIYRYQESKENNRPQRIRIGKLQDELDEKYGFGNSRGMRDLSARHVNLLGEFKMTDEQFEEYCLCTYQVIYSKKIVPVLDKNKKPVLDKETNKPLYKKEDMTAEEVYNAYKKLLPELRKIDRELEDLREQHKGLMQEPRKLESYTKGYALVKEVQSKAEGMAYLMADVAKNKKLLSKLTEKEKKEAIRMRAVSAATDSAFGQWNAVYKCLCQLTPEQLMNGEHEKILNNRIFERTYQERLENTTLAAEQLFSGEEKND